MLNAEYFRHLAKNCFELAEMMSRHRDRAQLIKIARRYNEIAARAETEKGDAQSETKH